MPLNSIKSLVPAGFTFLFLLLASSFWLDWWGQPVILHPVVPADPSFADGATVRQSAAELYRTDGDVSMLACYSCHDRDEPILLQFDEEGQVISEEHEVDFELLHGRRHQNESCFNCHASDNLERLITRDGRHLLLTESNALCGSCHGTTHRDWEIGIHGRVSGYWNAQLGEKTWQDCTSCHDPHAPAFPTVTPAPGPHPLRPLHQREAHVQEEETGDV